MTYSYNKLWKLQLIRKRGYISYEWNHKRNNVRDHRYFSGVPFGEFSEALEILNRKGVNYLVSYDGECGGKEYGEDGRGIAAYKFGNPDEAKNNLAKSAGRTILSKALKQALIDKYGSQCFVYLETMDSSILQVDRRIPYEIGGGHSENDIDYYMLFIPSANRAKSWIYERCSSWDKKDKS